MVGKYEETVITRYLLDMGIFIFTHGERETSLEWIWHVSDSRIFFFLLDNFHGLVVKD
jgi:hypothetical protein